MGTLPQAAVGLIQQVLTEQQVLGQGVAELVGVLQEQQARVGRQLTDVLDLLADPSFTQPRALAAKMAPIHVRCFGEFELRINGDNIEDWRAGKARALFQYLVCHHRQPARRTELIDALWPDPDAVAAASSLKVAVHALRQTLRDRPGGLSVHAHEAGYELCAPDLWLDVDEFERLCRDAERLDGLGRGPAALGLYAEAVELHRGDFLADSWDDWVVFRREGLKDQFLCCLAKLADAALENGDWQACIGRCRQILEQDRCREDAFRMLMVCHARLGQLGRVRRWYELCCRTLQSDLGVEPEPDTVRLFTAAMRRDQVGPVGPTGA